MILKEMWPDLNQEAYRDTFGGKPPPCRNDPETFCAVCFRKELKIKQWEKLFHVHSFLSTGYENIWGSFEKVFLYKTEF